MGRDIRHYNGVEITCDVIDEVRRIIRCREDGELIDCEWITSLDDICDLHNSYPVNEHVILGDDWAIAYSITNVVEIGLWVASDVSNNKFMQTMEMLRTMKNILLQSYGYDICSCMRHSTSYRFYDSFVKRGYLVEKYDDVKVDGHGKIKNTSPDLLFHDTVFSVTDKFVKRYKK